MNYFKKCIIALLLFLFAIYTIPIKTNIQKTLHCSNNIIVTVSGTYYSYLLKDDSFDGIIDIAGKKYTGKYTLINDLYGNFTDDYGQPTYLFLQFKKFSYISGSDGINEFTSEWNTDWNNEFQKKQNWNYFINQFHHFLER